MLLTGLLAGNSALQAEPWRDHCPTKTPSVPRSSCLSQRCQSNAVAGPDEAAGNACGPSAFTRFRFGPSKLPGALQCPAARGDLPLACAQQA